MTFIEFGKTITFAFKAIGLPIICIFLSGLNLWLLFKDWFNERYQRRCSNDPEPQQRTISDEDVSSILGKSKTVLSWRKEEMEEAANEVGEEKEEEKHKGEILLPYTHKLEREPEEDVNPAEERISLATQENRHATYDASVTVDEFSLLTGTLSGKPVSDNEKPLVKETLQKMQGTSFYEQFTAQIKGAEQIAQAILNSFEEEQDTDIVAPIDNGFDYNKYIRR